MLLQRVAAFTPRLTGGAAGASRRLPRVICFRMPDKVGGTRRFAALVGAERARTILEQAATFDAEAALRDASPSRLAKQDEWPAAADEALAVASALTDASRAQLYAALSLEAPDADLARLTRSAAEPGLKARVAALFAGPLAERRDSEHKMGSGYNQKNKQRTLAELAAMVPDGASIALGAASCIAGRSASCAN